MSENVYHIPAMLAECIDGLSIDKSGTYVDVTFGGGGHSREIMRHLGNNGHLYSFDQDIDAYANRIDDSRFCFVHSNFRYIENFLRYYDVEKVDGIIADLGVSFHHFDAADRGFSFRSDAPLDMRMNRKAVTDARQLLNNSNETQLCNIMRQYGDIKRPLPIVRAIIAARQKKELLTTGDLLACVEPLVNPRQTKKELAQIFQAIRIEVNGEMNALKEFLNATSKVLKPGGRLVILTYHSLEDRMVKNFIKTGNTDGIEKKDFFGNLQTVWKPITRGVLTPSETEIEANPRSRSAKLRIAERLDQTESDK